MVRLASGADQSLEPSALAAFICGQFLPRRIPPQLAAADTTPIPWAAKK
jgi:hypothetical protein